MKHTNIIDVRFFDYNEHEVISINDHANKVIDSIKSKGLMMNFINITGFEIFNDGVGTHTFLQYRHFYDLIEIACEALKVKFQIHWETNMAFRENREMVSWLLEKTAMHSKIKTTYVCVGAGMSLNDRILFQNNLRLYKKYIGRVQIILNSPNVKRLLADKDTYFKEVLYGNYPIVYKHYSSRKPEKKMIPDANQELNCLKFLVEHYPVQEELSSIN